MEQLMNQFIDHYTLLLKNPAHRATCQVYLQLQFLMHTYIADLLFLNQKRRIFTVAGNFLQAFQAYNMKR